MDLHIKFKLAGSNTQHETRYNFTNTKFQVNEEREREKRNEKEEELKLERAAFCFVWNCALLLLLFCSTTFSSLLSSLLTLLTHLTHRRQALSSLSLRIAKKGGARDVAKKGSLIHTFPPGNNVYNMECRRLFIKSHY